MTATTSRPTVQAGRGPSLRRSYCWWALRTTTAIALVIDAVVHLQDAHFYDLSGHRLSEGGLFRIQAAAAVAAALLVLVWPRRSSWAFALVVSASAVGAAVLFTYIDVGPFAGLPNLYEPSWAPPGKALSATAESHVPPRAPSTLVARVRSLQSRAVAARPQTMRK